MADWATITAPETQSFDGAAGALSWSFRLTASRDGH